MECQVRKKSPHTLTGYQKTPNLPLILTHVPCTSRRASTYPFSALICPTRASVILAPIQHPPRLFIRRLGYTANPEASPNPRSSPNRRLLYISTCPEALRAQLQRNRAACEASDPKLVSPLTFPPLAVTLSITAASPLNNNIALAASNLRP